jgi:putative flavoprotein involved in K+ transport
MNSFDAVIVGAGPAGVATSFFLQRRKISHVVLEKDRAFSEWYGRWDSFHMNTANWMNELPGATVEFAPGADRDALGTRADAIRYFEAYLSAVDPPIREGIDVKAVKQDSAQNWIVIADDIIFVARSVVICTGAFQQPRIPSLSAQLPGTLPQMHSRQYRNPEQITTAQVLIVGSGNSGVQICEDLARSKRFDMITLAVSGNITVPLEILGVSVFKIGKWLGALDARPTSWLGRKIAPADRGDPTIPPSPKQLSDIYGVELVGKVTGIDGSRLQCSDGRTVSLENLSIVWCTGFQQRHDFIEVIDGKSVFDLCGRPIHDRGVVSAAPGLYFVGLRFQSTVSSHAIYGVGRDAEFVAQHITGR